MISFLQASQATRFATSLLILATEFDFSVTSWGRTADHNAKVGGQPASQHLQFTGCDLVFDEKNDIAKFIARASQFGLFCLDEGDHIHVQRPKGKEW